MVKINKYEKTKYITGLRAYAALAVFLIHSGGGGLVELSSTTAKMVYFGRYGVTVFFVISAFTICMSIDNQTNFNFKSYIIKRFLRIAPMYYIVVIICFLLGGSQYYLDLFNVKNDIKNLVFHLTFLNLFNIRYINNIIGVEWSIPIEFFFYLIIPTLFFYLKRNKNKIVELVYISLFIYLILPKIFNHLFNPSDLGIHWSVFNHAIAFSIGIAIYILLNNFNFFKNISFNSLHVVLHLLILILFIYLDIPYQELFVSFWIGILVILLSGKSPICKILFENRIIQYLGKISFSFYLIHFPIINFLTDKFDKVWVFTLSLIATILLSALSYLFIEEPFIKLGKRVSKISKNSVKVSI